MCMPALQIYPVTKRKGSLLSARCKISSCSEIEGRHAGDRAHQAATAAAHGMPESSHSYKKVLLFDVPCSSSGPLRLPATLNTTFTCPSYFNFILSEGQRVAAQSAPPCGTDTTVDAGSSCQCLHTPVAASCLPASVKSSKVMDTKAKQSPYQGAESREWCFPTGCMQ